MIQNRCIFCFIVVYFIFVCVVQTFDLCPRRYFRLPLMKFCHPWLKCEDLKDIRTKNVIGYGSTKNVFLAEWKNQNISLSKLKNKHYAYDFYFGLERMKVLSPNKFILQLIGFCEPENIIITEYHDYNNALNFESFKTYLNTKQKLHLCINYVEIINFLHNSPIGILVNCDSNELEKLLSQLLITKDFSIVLGDVDALPEIMPNSSIKCGKKEIRSSLAAPEQIWQTTKQFNIKEMKGYNEKIDIWKIPDVCNYFLSGPDYELFQYRLFSIHRKCKDLDPNNRPTAKELLYLYNNLAELFA